MYDVYDGPSGWKILGYCVLTGFACMAVVTACNIISLPFTAVNNATQVARVIMSPENALQNYRYFHDASAALDVMGNKLKASHENLTYAEQHDPTHEQSRHTELTGLQQVCADTVAQYNSRAERIDSGFFRNPERWLPIAAAPWMPLPQHYSADLCQ